MAIVKRNAAPCNRALCSVKRLLSEQGTEFFGVAKHVHLKPFGRVRVIDMAILHLLQYLAHRGLPRSVGPRSVKVNVNHGHTRMYSADT
jgi:hypothetical protein